MIEGKRGRREGGRRKTRINKERFCATEEGLLSVSCTGNIYKLLFSFFSLTLLFLFLFIRRSSQRTNYHALFLDFFFKFSYFILQNDTTRSSPPERNGSLGTTSGYSSAADLRKHNTTQGGTQVSTDMTSLNAGPLVSLRIPKRSQALVHSFACLRHLRHRIILPSTKWLFPSHSYILAPQYSAYFPRTVVLHVCFLTALIHHATPHWRTPHWHVLLFFQQTCTCLLPAPSASSLATLFLTCGPYKERRYHPAIGTSSGRRTRRGLRGNTSLGWLSASGRVGEGVRPPDSRPRDWWFLIFVVLKREARGREREAEGEAGKGTTGRGEAGRENETRRDTAKGC